MASFDLTTVDAVNDWLNQASGTDSAEIQLAVTALSKKILNLTGRKSLNGVSSFSERYDGNGGNALLLRNYPIQAVSSLVIGGTTIPQSPDYQQQGWVIDDQGEQNTLRLISGGNNWSPYNGWGFGENGDVPSQWPNGCRGLAFVRGIQNVAVTYQAGYLDSAIDEAQNIPSSPGPYTVTAANAATWFADQGVPGFTAVASNPGPGQYSVSSGVYTFNAANQGAPVELNYTYGVTPEDLAQAVTVLVADNYRSRNWIAQLSVVQPGIGTTNYSKLSIPAQAADTIELYKRRFVA